jgi:hypothetical protein
MAVWNKKFLLISGSASNGSGLLSIATSEFRRHSRARGLNQVSGNGYDFRNFGRKKLYPPQRRRVVWGCNSLKGETDEPASGGALGRRQTREANRITLSKCEPDHSALNEHAVAHFPLRFWTQI